MPPPHDNFVTPRYLFLNSWINSLSLSRVQNGMLMELDAKAENYVDVNHIRELTAREIITGGEDPGLTPGNLPQSYPKGWSTYGFIHPEMRALSQPPQLETIELSVTLTEDKNQRVIDETNEWINNGKSEQGTAHNWWEYAHLNIAV